MLVMFILSLLYCLDMFSIYHQMMCPHQYKHILNYDSLILPLWAQRRSNKKKKISKSNTFEKISKRTLSN